MSVNWQATTQHPRRKHVYYNLWSPSPGNDFATSFLMAANFYDSLLYAIFVLIISSLAKNCQFPLTVPRCGKFTWPHLCVQTFLRWTDWLLILNPCHCGFIMFFFPSWSYLQFRYDTRKFIFTFMTYLVVEPPSWKKLCSSKCIISSLKRGWTLKIFVFAPPSFCSDVCSIIPGH